MSEQTNDLENLSIRYGKQVRELEDQLAEAKRRQQIANEALALLRGEGKTDKRISLQPAVSERFKDVSMTVAIKSILNSPQFRKASAAEMLLELQRNGYKSESKSPKRDVHTRLYRMERDGQVISAKEHNVKKYSLPKEEGDA